MKTRYSVLIKKFKDRLKAIGYTTTHSDVNRRKSLLKTRYKPTVILDILTRLERYYLEHNLRMARIYHNDRVWFESTLRHSRA